MTNQTVLVGGLIQGLLVALLGLVVAMGWMPLTDNQFAAWLGVIAAVVAIVNWWIYGRTVEISKLKTPDGEAVTKQDVTRGATVNWNG